MSDRPRDSYRSRLFAAEKEVVTHFGLDGLTTTQIRGTVERVTNWKWWTNSAKAYCRPSSAFYVRTSTNATKCLFKINETEFAYHGSNRVIVHRRPTKLEVVHALAHHLHPHDTILHGPEFCKAYLMLVSKVFNPTTSEYLAKRIEIRKANPPGSSAEPDEMKIEATKIGLKKILDDLKRDMTR